MARESVRGSFRDPSGFVFVHDGTLYRQINQSYKDDYEHLVQSGLYEALANAGLLVPHEEVPLESAQTDDAFKVLQPEPVAFIAYPYEWCFSQLKDAALATLRIQKMALEHGMALKDSSAFNIQFVRGQPVLIDTLSFERYREGQPWVAYRQFCQHFLAPLALMGYTDVRLNQILRVFIDGIPMDLAATLLPARSKLHFGLLTHLHLHAKAQRRFAGKRTSARSKRQMGKTAFRGLIDNLEGTARALKWTPEGTTWADYYDETNYSEESARHKERLVGELVDRVQPETVWDLGANTGVFSRIAAGRGARTISFDMDPACVERNYLDCKRAGETNLLPLVLDLSNPSPAIGWAHSERFSIAERGPADLVLALALIHHLAIANNVPLVDVAKMLATLGAALIIEFVEKGDSQVQRLLASREDVFPHYTQEAFESTFGEFFQIESRAPLQDSMRTLYLMRRRDL